MDYKRIYDELIEYRKKNPIIYKSQYSENHHIIPESLGGSNDKDNMVRLTGREHYVAHLLLARFWRCSENSFALWMMQMKSKHHEERPCIKNGIMYEWARKEMAKYISRNNRVTSKGELNSQHGTRWICNIDLKENKKIKKEDEIPDGWIAGKNKWKRFIKCLVCEQIFYQMGGEKFCSSKCKDNHMISIDRSISTKQRMILSVIAKRRIAEGNKHGQGQDTILINDGNTSKRINKNSEIPLGWIKGRIKKSCASISSAFEAAERVMDHARSSRV